MAHEWIVENDNPKMGARVKWLRILRIVGTPKDLRSGTTTEPTVKWLRILRIVGTCYARGYHY